MAFTVEVESLITFFIKFTKSFLNVFDAGNLLRPKTSTHKVQSYPVKVSLLVHLSFKWQYYNKIIWHQKYTSMALCCRFKGDERAANTFILEARSLAGSIFDTASDEAGTLLEFLFCFILYYFYSIIRF
jgi:hypothetical protein